MRIICTMRKLAERRQRDVYCFAWLIRQGPLSHRLRRLFK
jgi:hypothetical protein